jgi:hypothetical protein
LLGRKDLAPLRLGVMHRILLGVGFGIHFGVLGRSARRETMRCR